jgi:hypothetical protein
MPTASDLNLPPAGAPPPHVPPPLAPDVPPVLAPTPALPGPARRIFALLLSLYLALFLAEAGFALADDSLLLFAGSGLLSAPRLLLSLGAVLAGLGVYVLMGLTPWIPKRLFIPLALFHPLTGLASLPLLIWLLGNIQPVTWVLSLVQMVCGLVVWRACLGGFRPRWPLVPVEWLRGRGFTWRNTLGFVAVNVFVLAPLLALGMAWGVSVSVRHASDGFVQLRPEGITVRASTYVRPDGKTIQLIPMIHVGDAGFYRQLASSFPAGATVLMEGVTDNGNRLTNRISYQRMARTLGLSEQAQAFKPVGPEGVSADVDVSSFSEETLGMLNLIMLVQAKGLNPQTLEQLLRFTPEPGFEQRLFADILTKRNQHLLGEIQSRLATASHLVVPWGAAHMPEIGRELQQLGFRLADTTEHTAIGFRSRAARPD